MNEPISESQRESGAADDGGAAGQPLQPEHAFVVQLRVGPSSDRRPLRGRVEHVVSGETLHFASAAELIEFLARAGSSSRRSSR